MEIGLLGRIEKKPYKRRVRYSFVAHSANYFILLLPDINYLNPHLSSSQSFTRRGIPKRGIERGDPLQNQAFQGILTSGNDAKCLTIIASEFLPFIDIYYIIFGYLILIF